MANLNAAYIGLRSGGVLTIEKVAANEVRVDASEVQLWDVAYGLASENRFTGQVYRNPYSVAEHSVLGTYLFHDRYDIALRFLFHDGGEGFGIGDLHFKVKELFAARLRSVEQMVTVAVAKQFGLDDVLSDAIKATDKALGELETLILHPAKNRLAKLYDRPREAVEAQFSKAELGMVNGWFLRPTVQVDAAAELWVARYGELRKLIGDAKVVREETEKLLAVPGFLPYPAPYLEPAIVNKTQLRRELVEKEIKRLVSKNFLVVRDGYYHKGE